MQGFPKRGRMRKKSREQGGYIAMKLLKKRFQTISARKS
jgi:hypothetical protein